MLSESNASTDVENVAIKVKTPSRVIHFSDGIIEEFSEDEVDEVDPAPPLPVDEVGWTFHFKSIHICLNQITFPQSKLTWGPWFAHKAITTSTIVLAKCDAMGESIAEFLGITTPKYSYEIMLHKRMQEEQARIANEDKDSASWTEVSQLEGDRGDIVLDVPRAKSSELESQQKY